MNALKTSDRRFVERMADAAGVEIGALLPEIISAYLRLAKDVPAALPRDAMQSLSVAATRREKTGWQSDQF